jgi:predicted glycosyltransferase
MQPRIVIFCHDGRGLGHLQRMSRIARALQRKCSVLFVTGHRDASWIVPEICEYIHLPSKDSLKHAQSGQWGRRPFWEHGRYRGDLLRRTLLEATLAIFKPHAIMVDFLPLGKGEELRDIVETAQKIKLYYVMRGILDTEERVNSLILTDTVRSLLATRFHRLFVAADPTIVDVAREYNLEPEICNKMQYCGYVVDRFDTDCRAQFRRRRGLLSGSRWVVCSAGGGKEGEDLTQECLRMASQIPGTYFDVVLGPRSRAIRETGVSSDCRVIVKKQDADLPGMHAACDIVVGRGGYNTLLEAYSGSAQVVCCPIPGDYEQYTHAKRLQRIFPMTIVERCDQVHGEVIRLLMEERLPERGFINTVGADTIASIVISDLSK